LGEFKSALLALEPLLELYDQDAELSFLLALSNFHLNRPHTAQLSIQKAENLIGEELRNGGDGVLQLKQSIDDLSKKVQQKCLETDHDDEEDDPNDRDDNQESDDNMAS